MTRIRTIGFLITVLALPLCSAIGANMADFIRCIGPQGQGPVCQLDPGTYQINSTLLIRRSNITIKGTIINSRRDTTLQRAPAFNGILLADPFAFTATPILTSVTIRDFTFDGNRDQQSRDFRSFGADVFFFTTKSVLVTNCDFINSPKVSLELRQGASGVVINNSYVANATIDGIATGPSTPGLSEAANAYMLCDSFLFPSNIVITNSKFEDAGANGVYLQAKNVRISDNLFQRNHKDAPFNSSGGQIDLSICTDNAAVIRNTFKDGPATPNGWWADGIEVHGRNVTVVDNLVTNNAGTGMILVGVQNFFTANWDPRTGVIANNKMPFCCFGGIAVYNLLGWRPTDAVIIDHANIVDGNEYGIEFTNKTPNVPINHITITNNCLRGNRQGGVKQDVMGPDVVIQNNLTSGCGPN